MSPKIEDTQVTREVAVLNGNLRDRIRSRPRVKGKLLDVEEWEATVELRSMSIEQKGRLLGDDAEPSPAKVTAMLPEIVIATCYDPATDAPVFTADDLDWLKDEPANVIERLANEGLTASGVTEQAAAEKKDSS